MQGLADPRRDRHYRAMLRRGTFENWGGNQRCRPASFHVPAGEDALRGLVRDVAARGERLRVVGAGHSWSDAPCTDGHMVSLDGCAGVVAVDPEAREITVEGGIRLRDLVEVLAERGLAMVNLGSVAEQSIAGATATGTHGTGAKLGCLSTQIRRLRLVTARGDAIEVGPDDPELFSAARLSLGALGVVSRVTWGVREASNLEESAYAVDLDALSREVDAVVERNDHVKFWWLPHQRRVQVFAYNRTARAATAVGLGERLAASPALNGVFGAVLLAGRAFSPLIPPLNRLVAGAYFRPAHRVARSDRVLNIAMPPRHVETEYAIPRARTGEALRALRATIERLALDVNFVVEWRFVAADDLMLSPAFGRDVCHVTACVAPCRDADRYLRAFEGLMIELGGRPHWGKVFHVEHPELEALVPNLARFDALRRRMDPGGTFANAFVRRVFGVGE